MGTGVDAGRGGLGDAVKPNVCLFFLAGIFTFVSLAEKYCLGQKISAGGNRPALGVTGYLFPGGDETGFPISEKGGRVDRLPLGDPAPRSNKNGDVFGEVSGDVPRQSAALAW